VGSEYQGTRRSIRVSMTRGLEGKRSNQDFASSGYECKVAPLDSKCQGNLATTLTPHDTKHMLVSTTILRIHRVSNHSGGRTAKHANETRCGPKKSRTCTPGRISLFHVRVLPPPRVCTTSHAPFSPVQHPPQRRPPGGLGRAVSLVCVCLALS